jgi:hypothetical protein
MRVVLSNRVLLVFSAASLVTMTSLYTVSSLGLYINIYHIFHSDKVAAATMMGIWGTTFNLIAMLSIPGVMWLANRIGKHRAIMVALGMVCVSAFLKFFLYTPALPYLQLATALLHAPGLAAYLVLVNSMTADLVDYDESLNGRRREWLDHQDGRLALFHPRRPRSQHHRLRRRSRQQPAPRHRALDAHSLLLDSCHRHGHRPVAAPRLPIDS